LKKQIDDNGCFNIHLGNHKVKVYTPELALIFVSKELPARNIDTGIATTINGWDYLKTYIEAYKEGEQYFENEFKVSPNTLYGANAGQYVSDIHSNFFHVKHTGVIEGWSYVKRNYLITITYQAVKEYGYYSGIVSKVEELIEKYHQLFVTFDKCEYGLCKHNTPPKQAEKKSKGLKIDQIAIIYVYEGNQITRENGNEIAKQYNHNSGEKLFQRFTYFSSIANRKGKPTPCTPTKLKNKIELFESIVPHLTDTAKQRANDEIQILKTIFESEFQ